jgi:hypothetical protein
MTRCSRLIITGAALLILMATQGSVENRCRIRRSGRRSSRKALDGIRQPDTLAPAPITLRGMARSVVVAAPTADQEGRNRYVIRKT